MTTSDVVENSQPAGHLPMGPAELAQFIDHTLLRPEATRAEIADLVATAVDLGVYAVCVSPVHLPLDVPLRADGTKVVKVTTVVGFPSGAHKTAIKVAEATQAVADGADEIDMVVDLGAAKERRFDDVRADIAAVRAVVPQPLLLKVVVESAVLSDHELIETCRAAADAGADYIKTSTGYHPAGGVTTRAVGIISGTIGGRLGLKASGGLSTAADAISMITAGASRLGMSRTAEVLDDYLADTGS
ncbi:MAG: deoxyribose-phosphate aldolase [Micrococcales bacterium]|nr:deoxyribose-phosphate aldolase [Micrococcales bacterium]